MLFDTRVYDRLWKFHSSTQRHANVFKIEREKSTDGKRSGTKSDRHNMHIEHIYTNDTYKPPALNYYNIQRAKEHIFYAIHLNKRAHTYLWMLSAYTNVQFINIHSLSFKHMRWCFLLHIVVFLSLLCWFFLWVKRSKRTHRFGGSMR